jgi:hypothetical protein
MLKEIFMAVNKDVRLRRKTNNETETLLASLLRESSAPIESENARLGYQSAVDIATFYATTVWSIFNAMLMAHSIFVAVIGLVLTSNHPLILFKFMTPIVGLVLCVAWFLLVKRAHEYAAYYRMSAREIEEEYLEDSVSTVSRGAIFASGGSVTFKIGGRRMTHRLSLPVRTLAKGEELSYVAILPFAIIYVLTFIQT